LVFRSIPNIFFIYTYIFFAAFFKELALITIREMLGLEARSWTSK